MLSVYGHSFLSTQTNQSHQITFCFLFFSFNEIAEINSEAFRYRENTNYGRTNSRARIRAFLDTEKAILKVCRFSFKRRPFKCTCVNKVFFCFPAECLLPNSKIRFSHWVLSLYKFTSLLFFTSFPKT